MKTCSKRFERLWTSRQRVLGKIASNQPVEVYRKALKTSAQVTRYALHKFGIKFKDGRGGSNLRVERAVALQALQQGEREGLTLRQLGRKLNVSHEAVRLIAAELKFKRTPVTVHAGRRKLVQHKTLLALRFRRRYWLLWSREKLARRVGIGDTTLQRGLDALRIVWPRRRELRQQRLKQRGELWCAKHKQWLPAQQFNLSEAGDTNLGHQGYCRECHAGMMSRRTRQRKALVGGKSPC